MLSIIVCSKGPLHIGFVNNVRDTIGCEYEIVSIENPGKKYSICEAYNLGASKSIFSIFVFVHDDVIFRSNGWGNILLKLAGTDDIGIIGCAGSVFKSDYPTAWVDVQKKYYRTNVIDGWTEKKTKHVSSSDEFPIADVVVLDGMFLCMSKAVWHQFPFNDKDLKGFHLYDLDICLRSGEKYRNIVSYEILLEHLSPGNFDETWFRESLKFHNKWKTMLPKASVKLSASERKNVQYYALVKCIRYYLAFNLKSKMVFKYLTRLFLYKPLSKYNWIILKSIMKNRLHA